MKQIAISNGHAWPIFRIPWNFENFHDKLGLGPRNDIAALAWTSSLRISCNSLKFSDLMNFSCHSWHGPGLLGDVNPYFRYQPQFWWHDAQYSEADRYLRWPRLANFCAFHSTFSCWPAEGVVVLWKSWLINNIHKMNPVGSMGWGFIRCLNTVPASHNILMAQPGSVWVLTSKRSSNIHRGCAFLTNHWGFCSM